jgi:hypothetical protein
MTQKSSRPAAGLGAELVALLQKAINFIFALEHKGSRRRSFSIFLGIALIWIVLVALRHSAAEWGALWQPVFRYVLQLEWLDKTKDTTALGNLLAVLAHEFFLPEVIRHILALYFPMWLAHSLASIYLADVFEKPADVAYQFIRQASLGVGYNTIHIREGKVIAEDQDSPIVQIGGPGYVQVELDSAALFEKSGDSNSPHVMPPTGNEHDDHAVIEGFERLRQGVDLRDYPTSQEVFARSREGIPVNAKDIQYTYSILRGSAAPTAEMPYPFDASAVERLFYGATQPAKPNQKPLAKPSWQASLPGGIYTNINSEIGEYVSKRSLSEFLASIGTPEVRAFSDREQGIVNASNELASEGGNAVAQEPIQPGSFDSRALLKRQFEHDDFNKRLTNKGVQLKWIGVGTWKSNTEVILDDHLEAWMLTRENTALGNDEEINRIRSDARLREMTNIIKQTPVSTYDENEKSGIDDNTLIRNLLEDYLQRLWAGVEWFETRGHQVPPVLRGAIEKINRILDKRGHEMGS